MRFIRIACILLPLDDGDTELGISGPCLAEGYVGDSDTTDSTFVWIDSTRVYRTGDVVSSD
ncbi:hypothetical protein D4740_08395 [Actinomyces sp. 2119]|uniref:AMP-dependent synthetase/ligase domain-containing protein n=1 Tax=Actinomyces lilanjuaniae TaxID=2321394 RepID=A0ABM6Z6X1_9ACTO|nr:hypothetical protein D5R93_09395 [Actinomyces lilanjuaniae]RJF41591.1 hypothetical protein D4740_08395 [Actinomyces sp. 2119]